MSKKTISFLGSLLVLLLLSWIWKTSNPELVWLLLPTAGLFRQIAGTWNKAVGRFLLPAAIAIAYTIFVGFSIWTFVIFLAYVLSQTLPITLVGNSIPGHWINWIWVWVLGLIHGIVCLSIGIPVDLVGLALVLSAVPAIVYGVFITLSNIKGTDKFFVWKMVEFFLGVAIAYPPTTLLELNL